MWITQLLDVNIFELAKVENRGGGGKSLRVIIIILSMWILDFQVKVHI